MFGRGVGVCGPYGRVCGRWRTTGNEELIAPAAAATATGLVTNPLVVNETVGLNETKQLPEFRR